MTTPRPAAGVRSAAAPPAGVVVRPLASLAEYRACVALQQEIWGDGGDVAVPASLMQVCAHVGGLALGAFAPNGQLVGFVFGIAGLDGGKVIHWSHMLGVRQALRNAGIGRLLKESQRSELARRQIPEMYWTFDPLIARNAHLNLNVLGARVVRYVRDMYGDTGSPLHRGRETDRLVVVCDTARAPGTVLPAADADEACTPLLTAHSRSGDPLFSPGSEPAPRVRIEVPTDFAQLLADAPADAKAWHAATREYFQWALAHEYVVTGFRRDPATARSFYVLEWRRRSAPGAN